MNVNSQWKESNFVFDCLSRIKLSLPNAVVWQALLYTLYLPNNDLHFSNQNCIYFLFEKNMTQSDIQKVPQENSSENSMSTTTLMRIMEKVKQTKCNASVECRYLVRCFMDVSLITEYKVTKCDAKSTDEEFRSNSETTHQRTNRLYCRWKGQDQGS